MADFRQISKNHYQIEPIMIYRKDSNQIWNTRLKAESNPCEIDINIMDENNAEPTDKYYWDIVYSLIYIMTKKQLRVALLLCDMEYMALADTLQKAKLSCYKILWLIHMKMHDSIYCDKVL